MEHELCVFTAREPAPLSYLTHARTSGVTSSETGVSGLRPVPGCRAPAAASGRGDRRQRR